MPLFSNYRILALAIAMPLLAQKMPTNAMEVEEGFDPSIPPPSYTPSLWSIFKSPLFWIITGLVLVAIYFIIKAIRYKPIPATTPSDMRAKALTELDSLRQQNLSPKDCANEVWRISREYLAAKFKIPAMSRTSWELFHKVIEPKQASQLSTNGDFWNARDQSTALLHREQLVRFEPLAKDCDLCQFAPIEKATINCKKLIDHAFDLIQNEKLNA